MRAEEARAQQPDGNVEPGAWHRAHDLAWLHRGEVGLQLLHVARKVVLPDREIAAKRSGRQRIRSRRTPETEIDACLPFTYGIVESFAREMQRRGIKPEVETYHSGGAWVVRDLIDRGLLKPPYLIQTVMGTQTASYPTPEHVIHLLRELPAETVWLCSGIGPFQLPLTTFALLMGGHARVGLEDNLYFSRGRKFVDNAAVRRVVRIAHELNRAVATPAQTRQMLGLATTE